MTWIDPYSCSSPSEKRQTSTQTTMHTQLATSPTTRIGSFVQSRQSTESAVASHAHLDSVRFIRDINLAADDFSVNVLGRINECGFDIVGCFRGCFQKDQVVGFGKGLSFFGRYRPTVL